MRIFLRMVRRNSMAGMKKRYPNPGPPLSPEFLEGIKRGVEDMKAGRVKPWEQVKQELNMEDDQAGRGDFGH